MNTYCGGRFSRREPIALQITMGHVRWKRCQRVRSWMGFHPMLNRPGQKLLQGDPVVPDK